MVTPGEKGEFGTGTQHLYNILKRLAVIEPAAAGDAASEDVPQDVADIFEEIENSHNILVSTTRKFTDLPAETNIVNF